MNLDYEFTSTTVGTIYYSLQYLGTIKTLPLTFVRFSIFSSELASHCNKQKLHFHTNNLFKFQMKTILNSK